MPKNYQPANATTARLKRPIPRKGSKVSNLNQKKYFRKSCERYIAPVRARPNKTVRPYPHTIGPLRKCEVEDLQCKPQPFLNANPTSGHERNRPINAMSSITVMPAFLRNASAAGESFGSSVAANQNRGIKDDPH
jgi:hypothetical protein